MFEQERATKSINGRSGMQQVHREGCLQDMGPSKSVFPFPLKKTHLFTFGNELNAGEKTSCSNLPEMRTMDKTSIRACVFRFFWSAFEAPGSDGSWGYESHGHLTPILAVLVGFSPLAKAHGSFDLVVSPCSSTVSGPNWRTSYF